MASPDEQDFPGHLLHQAALWDNADLLLDLLNGDLLTLLNSQDSWGRTPLHAAATTENSKCLKILLEAGANPNLCSGAQDNFKTPLHVCAEHGFLQNVRNLVESGADTTLLTGHRWTAYDLAERGGHILCCEYLRDAAKFKEETRESLHLAIREAVESNGTAELKSLLREINSTDTAVIINMTPNGANSLLFKACEAGNKQIVQILIDNGADERVHPVTKYSPLYIAAYHGFKDIVTVVLKAFPALIRVPTVEKWLPLHACCINGHVGVLDLLLKFEYPSKDLKVFNDAISGLDYRMAFDINFKDVSNQTALYIACQMNNQRLVEALLKFRVKAFKPGEEPVLSEPSPQVDTNNVPSELMQQKKPSPNRRISQGIQGILSKLSKAANQDLMASTEKTIDDTICPVDVNCYCEEYQTALHVAVKHKNHIIANVLLVAKADPNLAILPCPVSVTGNSSEEENKSRGSQSSTALVEACIHRDLGMIELLIKHGARDDSCKALSYVMHDDLIVGKILSLKAHLDTESKLDMQYLQDILLKSHKKALVSSSMLPTSPVNINWHSQKLDRVTEQWLTAAALRINPRLRLSPKNQYMTMHSITRLDFSENGLEIIPAILFTLSSLKYLNLNQNKIYKMEFPPVISSLRLEELLLQDNRFDVVPEELFCLFPALTILNLSNNKIKKMPACMWSSPMLQELNLSLNLLTDLPAITLEDAGGEINMYDSLLCIEGTAKPESTSVDLSTPSSPDFVMVDNESTREKMCFSKSIKLNDTKDTPSKSPLLVHYAMWREKLKILTNSESIEKSFFVVEESSLTTLNLSHNAFKSIPKVLCCLGVNVHRLNLSFNNLKGLGHITDYPASLRQLDVSSNRIETWFAAIEEKSIGRQKCWNARKEESLTASDSDQDLCPHRRHTRLENLKTLLVGNNQLKNIFVFSEEMELLDASQEKAHNFAKNLWFPNVTMLDISENKLKEITPRIADLTSLSVLNLSGNVDLTELPPEMGLLSRMWNLNTARCNLQEPLKSMIESKRCKTMDIIGYLKSVLEDAKPYSRMKLMVVGIQGIGKTSLLSQLRQEGIQKQVHQDHWSKRIGAAGKLSSPKGKTISTVGVDIGTWVLDSKGKPTSSSCGPVTFRTWDFGGQKEYYATHLYFLSRRSLYLVVWNICDGEKGLNEIIQWLVNIQARAPNSPVIIVGTHFDLVSEKFPPGYLDYLQQKIRDKFICITDPEKRGLPRVLYSVEISCRTRHNIKHLCNLIYDTVVNIKTSNGKRLLEQKIPSKYIHLEEIVAFMAMERKQRGLDPVLKETEFKIQVTGLLQKGFNLSFRDDAEILQACSFLHENGVLLHYEDSTLRDLFFLDPQWLCDMLAHVVTVKEVNPFAKYGIMKVTDLEHLFKSQSSNTRDYVLSLLSKFELAVPWDEVHLLIPSLLPSFEQMRIGQNEVRVKIPVRSRAWMLKKRENSFHRQLSADAALSLDEPPTEKLVSEESSPSPEAKFIIQDGSTPCINRFLLLSYFPSGFWPRLIARILSDDRIVEIVRNYFMIPPPSEVTPEVVELLDKKAEWSCWQTGMELTYGDLLILRLKEIYGEKSFSFMLRRDDGAFCEAEVSGQSWNQKAEADATEHVWDVVDLNETGLLELHIPAYAVTVNSTRMKDNDGGSSPKTKSTLLQPSLESLAKLLALVVDQVDTLLEDWYPSIGTRFVHTSEGKYLVTRLIPCPKCFPTLEAAAITPSLDEDSAIISPSPQSKSSSGRKSADFLKQFGLNFGGNRSPRLSSDSGMGYSPHTTRVSSVDSTTEVKENETISSIGMVKGRAGILPTGDVRFICSGGENGNFSGLNFFLKNTTATTISKSSCAIYSWSVEYCILQSQMLLDQDFLKREKRKSYGEGDQPSGVSETKVRCPKHGVVLLRDICPDVLFLDLNTRFLLDHRSIQRGSLLGRGAFGFVFRGHLNSKYENKTVEIAIKMFQPVDPGGDDDEARAAYKLAINKWYRAPSQSACRSYVAARGEVRVLYWVCHPNVVPFIGLCQSPLSIVMPRAPKGALDAILSDYKRSGDKVSTETIRLTVLQIGKALEYLHSHRIIYRDLKSENVLVWNFPPPFASKAQKTCVEIKLADYGISRSSFPTGSKGFGGTEGFMAPEIIRYNGEEEYTEKVDIFSFGMVIYELLSLRQPFDGCENVKESILEGVRPSLAKRDCMLYPLYVLDLMVVCWSHNPKDRPTASQIVSVCTSPEFTILRDVVALANVSNVVSAVGLQYGAENEIWASCSTGSIYCLKLTSVVEFISCLCFEFISGVVTAMCHVDNTVWMGDTLGKIYVLSVSDYSKVVERDLESQVGYCGAIVSIKRIDDIVAVAVTTGRLFLCDSQTAELHCELGKSTLIHCLSCRSLDTGGSELWAGEKSGQMTIYTIKDGTVTAQEILNHYEPIIEAVEVLLVDTHSSNEIIFSYVYPGSVVYGWQCDNREMISRLDVGKLLPVRDYMEDELNHKPLQVTVLKSTITEVYIGTNRGFVFVADVKNLRPLTSFRPFTEDVRSFWIFRRMQTCSTIVNLSMFAQVNSLDLSDSSAPDARAQRLSTDNDSGTDEHSGHQLVVSSDQRSDSTEKLASESNNVRNFPHPSENTQIVVGIGKGFNTIIPNASMEAVGNKQRRRAFAMLWHVKDGWN